MLGATNGAKKYFTLLCLPIIALSLWSANSFAMVIQAKPIVWYNVYGRAVSGPKIESLTGLLSEEQAKSFSACMSTPEDGYLCSNFSYSNSKTPGSGPKINGLPEYYYNVGESTGTAFQKVSATADETSWTIQNPGVTVKVNQSCPIPFGSRVKDDRMWCETTLSESDTCDRVGNPIDPATGTKFEQEVDYSSADGLLTVERTYLGQSKGWAIDQPIELSIVAPGETVPFPSLFMHKNVQLFPKELSVSPARDYEYVFPILIYNISATDEVYMWNGRQQARFSDNGSTFVSNDSAAKNVGLQKINQASSLPEKWLLTLANSDKHYFTAGGKIVRSEFADGGVISYVISGNRLLSKSDQTGRSIVYNYDADGRLVSVVPPDGKVITYTYGSNKDLANFHFLSKVTWANGQSVSYLYNEPANMPWDAIGLTVALTGKLDSLAQRVGNYQYSGDKAVLTEGFAGINRKQLSYSGYSTRVTDALNSTRTYQYIEPVPEYKLLSRTSQPAGSGCSASVKDNTYYSGSELKQSTTDFNGHRTQYAYDTARKLETVRVEGIPAGDVGDYLPQNSTLATGIRKITTQWHSQLNQPVKTAEPRLLTTLIYNGDIDPFNGNSIAQCAPASLPLLCHKIEQATTDINGALGLSAALDSATSKREWLYTYNDRGQLLTQARAVNGAPEETREYYESTNSLATKGDLKRIANALGQTTEFTQYDANGRVLRMLDANRVETQYSYDVRGRLLSQSVAGAATLHTYDLNGNRTRSVLPNGGVLNYVYDPMHRLTAIENAQGDKIQYEYDLESNLRFERVTNASGAIGYIKEHIYDALSREQSTRNSLGQSQTHLYDANGNYTGNVDAKQQASAQSFNALSQLKVSTDALNGKTEYSYDGQGRITQVKDPKGNATSYTYNGFGDLLTQTSPDTGTTTFTYDAAGNRTSATDARGVVVNYTYDALNRLTSVGYPAASGENVTYGYDDIVTGVWGSNYGVGRLTSISNSLAITTYKYNELGLIKMKRAALNGITFVTSYTYDPAGNLTGITYPSGRMVNYTRDTVGRVQSVKTKLNASAAEETVVSGISYLPFGPANNYTYGNGLSHAANYDNDYRLTSIQVGGILNRSYSYDPVDNITSIGDLVAASKNQTFAYDPVNRLTSASGIYGALTYTYDAVGNRLSEKTVKGATQLNDTYTYSPTSNRLTSISQTNNGAATGTRSFSYDNAGNRTQGTTAEGQTQIYTYNKANRLETAKVAGALVGTYVYNALGQRVIKTLAGGGKELYQYDEAGQLIAVADATGKNMREYVYHDNQLVGFVNVGVVASTSSSSSSVTSSISSSKSSSIASSLRSSSASSSSAASIAAITLDEATATIVGNHAVGSGFTGFTGSGFIDYTGEGQVNWSFNVAASASYTVSVRYALSGTTADRPLTLLVDGVQKGTFSFPPTATWSTWANTATITVALTAGSHTLSLKTNGQSGPNIDKVVITPIIASGAATAGAAAVAAAASASSIAPIVRDEATAVLVGSHSIGSGFAGFTGSGFIDYNGEGQVNWPLTIASSANYTIAVRYALSGTTGRPLALLVNGVQKATFNIAATTSWTTWTTETKTIALTAGSHTISLKTTGQSGPNVDRMDITAIATVASSVSSSAASSSRASSSSVMAAISSSSRLSSSNSSAAASSSAASQTPVATLYFVHNDHLGTPQVMTSKTQAVVYMADYQPFGKLQANQTNSIELYSRFPGQYLDSETGLYYNYFRDYDPSIGRYIESDPIGLGGGINTYAYVEENPLIYKDQFGLQKGVGRRGPRGEYYPSYRRPINPATPANFTSKLNDSLRRNEKYKDAINDTLEKIGEEIEAWAQQDPDAGEFFKCIEAECNDDDNSKSCSKPETRREGDWLPSAPSYKSLPKKCVCLQWAVR